MNYEDFSLHFERADSDSIRVRVLSSPAGEGKAACLLNLIDLHALRAQLVEHLSDAGPLAREEVSRLGSRLFDGLFQGQVRELLDHSEGLLGSEHSEEARCLRIVLRLDPTDSFVAALYSVPWELLYRRDQEQFVALSRRFSIVRHLEVPRPARAMPLPLPLRVLAVTSRPHGLPGVEQEIVALERTLGGSEGVELSVLRNTTLERLRAILVERPFHVVHFIGHGDFNESTGVGVLFLEDESGQAAQVTGESLAAVLADVTSIRLVVLNACGTGQATAGDLANPFAGVATALVLCGIPAVVGMQFPITDLAAVKFSSVFYQRITSGDTIDRAVSEARLGVFTANPETIEWATPALFLRVTGGNIFVRVQGSDVQGLPDLHQAARVAVYESGTTIDEESGTKREVGTGAGQPRPLQQENSRLAIDQAFDGVRESTVFVLKQIELVYEQTRGEAHRWSVGSLTAAGVGLFMVVTTLVSLLIGRVDLGTITAIGSAVPTVVAGLFFAQWRIASRRLGGIAEELNAARRMHFAQQIADTLETPAERDKAKAAIVLALLDRRG